MWVDDKEAPEGFKEALERVEDRLGHLELAFKLVDQAVGRQIASTIQSKGHVTQGMLDHQQRLDARLTALEDRFQTWFDHFEPWFAAFENPDAATRDIRMETAVISVVSVAEQRVAAMHKEGTEDRNALRDLIRKVEDLATKQAGEVQERLDHLDTNFDSVARAAVRRALKDMAGGGGG